MTIDVATRIRDEAMSKLQDLRGAETLRSVEFPEGFIAGARNAVTTCLRIQPEEKVTLITDESCITIAASLGSELDRIGCPWNAFILESEASRPLVGMPPAV